MKKDSLIGETLNIEWQGDKGKDILGNAWTRKGNKLYRSLPSDTSVNLGIQSFVTVDAEGKIADIAYDPCLCVYMEKPKIWFLQKQDKKQLEQYLWSIIRTQDRDHSNSAASVEPG